MGINFNLLNSTSVGIYARDYHVSTRESWTEEDFQAESKRFFFTPENRDIYIEDYLNFRQEGFRRAIEDYRNHNPFETIIRDLDPNIIVQGRSWDFSDVCVIQTLANTFEQGKNHLLRLNGIQNGAFVCDEDLAVRLNLLHERFNEAFQALAEIFTRSVNVEEFRGERSGEMLEMPNIRNDPNTDRMIADLLAIGERIRHHISSGEPSSTISEMLLKNNDLARAFVQFGGIFRGMERF